MQRFSNLRVAPTESRTFAVGLGIDAVSSAMSIKPGFARGAFNYEARYGGGFERARGFERFDGRPRPSDAEFTLVSPSTSFTSPVVGDVVSGGTSLATAIIAGIAGSNLALTKVVGTFVAGEQLIRGGSPIGAIGSLDPAIDVFDANAMYAGAADIYRADIAAAPGSGAIRGISALGSKVYAWRDNAGGTAMEIYESSSSGWTIVPRYYEYSFTGGGTAYTEGGTLTQGSVSATVKRVVLESGAWGGTAAGRLITTIPTGGAAKFANGAATGTGTCTLASVPATTPLAQITLSPAGTVRTVIHNFYGSTDTKRIYGCDGVNREFEFDGAVLVPLNTGMGSVRASFVAAHRNFLWFAYKGSLQKSAAGSPYVWSAVLGAAEIGPGDTITGLAAVPGDDTTSSLVVACANSLHVLYGSTTDTFTLVTLSREAGANHGSLQLGLNPICHDQQGFRVIRPTQAFGNFGWDIASQLIDPLARDRTPVCAIFAKKLSRYRCWFSDGLAITGTPSGKGIAWTQINYGITPSAAFAGEVSGEERCFFGSSTGMVYEMDVGRSFDGSSIECVLRLSAITLGSPGYDKRWRELGIEADSDSAFELSVNAEFDEGDPDNAPVGNSAVQGYGIGGRWDEGLYDRSRWDSVGRQSKAVEVPGVGFAVAPVFYSASSSELSHTIRSISVTYTPGILRKRA